MSIAVRWVQGATNTDSHWRTLKHPPTSESHKFILLGVVGRMS